MLLQSDFIGRAYNPGNDVKERGDMSNDRVEGIFLGLPCVSDQARQGFYEPFLTALCTVDSREHQLGLLVGVLEQSPTSYDVHTFLPFAPRRPR